MLLIEAGADVNVQNNTGGTALKFASGRGHTEVAQLLIEAGAKE
jgi:ankyrin repeat protein